MGTRQPDGALSKLSCAQASTRHRKPTGANEMTRETLRLASDVDQWWQQ